MRSAMQCTISGRSSRTTHTIRRKPPSASNGPKLRRSFSSDTTRQPSATMRAAGARTRVATTTSTPAAPAVRGISAGRSDGRPRFSLKIGRWRLEVPVGDAVEVPWRVLVIVLLAAIALSAGLILALRPLLVRYALARPNARSSHSEPTPQGGGIAVVVAALASLWLGGALAGLAGDIQLAGLTLAAAILALIATVDDIRGLGPLPRLVMQAVAVGLVVATLPADFRIVPLMPQALAWALLLLGGLWFVNLVNFMDGIDWITVAETVPITAGVVLLGLLGAVPLSAVLVALALLGAIIGFAPFNRPVARLLPGDVGDRKSV